MCVVLVKRHGVHIKGVSQHCLFYDEGMFEMHAFFVVQIKWI